MKSYFGYDKPYVYIAYSKKDDISDFLSVMEEKEITCCLNNNSFSKQESKKIEAAFSVVLFMSKNLLREKFLNDVVTVATRCNKNILCIYLEKLELDASLSMQLNSQQAIFKYQTKEYIDRIQKAEIFKDMKITNEQKTFQRRRTLSLVGVVGISAALIFGLVVYPLLFAKEETKIEIPGLEGLSEADLLAVDTFALTGEEIFNDEIGDYFNAQYSNDSWDKIILQYSTDGGTANDMLTVGTVDDISVVSKMKNVTKLVIVGEEINDISPILELENLEYLWLDCNPISSIEGISKLKNLKSLSLNNTNISDVSEIMTMDSLERLSLNDCHNITSIDGIENTNITWIRAANCNITEIKDLGKRHYTHVEVHENYIQDLSFLNTTESIDSLCIPTHNVKNALKNVEGVNAVDVSFNDVQVPLRLEDIKLTGLRNLTINGNKALQSLENIDILFPDLEYFHTMALANYDLRPLLKLKKLHTFITTTEYEEAVYSQIYDEANFSIYIRDDRTGYTEKIK